MEGPVETTRDLATRAYQSYQYDQVLEAETFWKDIRVHLAERGALEWKPNGLRRNPQICQHMKIQHPER